MTRQLTAIIKYASTEKIQERLHDKNPFHFPYTESELLADLTPETVHAHELAKLMVSEFGD
ncbi:MAG: hypothetical protein OXM61_18520 [Candidatus Poribacteria bacterium]|nr:hypothetical protein [Candidatus Poribacteria bacterium]